MLRSLKYTSNCKRRIPVSYISLVVLPCLLIAGPLGVNPSNHFHVFVHGLDTGTTNCNNSQSRKRRTSSLFQPINRLFLNANDPPVTKTWTTATTSTTSRSTKNKQRNSVGWIRTSLQASPNEDNERVSSSSTTTSFDDRDSNFYSSLIQDFEGSKVSELFSDLRGKFKKVKEQELINVVRRHHRYPRSSASSQVPCLALRGGGYSRSDHGASSSSRHIRNTLDRDDDDDKDDSKVMIGLDRFGRSLSFTTAGLVLMQSLGTLLSNYIDRYTLMNELASALLSEQSAEAVRTIRNILINFPNFGVIDVFTLYPTKDVVNAVLALSRLQKASLFASKLKEENDEVQQQKRLQNPIGKDFLSLAMGNKQDSIFSSNDDILDGGGERSNNNRISIKNNSLRDEQKLLSELAHYAVFAHAAYGWKMGILSGRMHTSDLKLLLRATGIKEEDVLDTNWHAKTHRPAYFIVRDVKKRKIVLSIRGTLSARDVLTDLCCTAEDFTTHDEAERPIDDDLIPSKYRARAHHGMLEAARGVSKMARKVIASELASNPGYDLVIVGHSLGGGTAAVLGTMWQDTFPGVKVYAYGCPCVGPLNFHPSSNDSIVSVVGEGDPFSCLSLGHLADVSAALEKLCLDDKLRKQILQRTQSNVANMTEEDLNWSVEQMMSIREVMCAEKFYPPGRILLMGGNLLFGSDDEITLKEVPQDQFQDLNLHSRMLDLSRHVPHRYEAVLRRLWSHAQKDSMKL